MMRTAAEPRVDGQRHDAFPEPASLRLRPPLTHHAHYVLRRLAKTMERLTAAIRPGDQVLDYGCGDMPYKPLFLARGAVYVSADLDGNMAADLSLSADGRVPESDATFDWVISSQVLEHVQEPGTYLSEARRVLRAGGTLVLSTHGYWRYHPHPEDYWRWTATGLRRAVEDSGFVVEQLEGIMGLAAAATQLWQDAVYPRIPRLLRPFFIAAMQLGVALQDRVLRGEAPDLDSAVYVVVAKKTEAPAEETTGAVDATGIAAPDPSVD